jgi:hypothetical protein
MRQIARSKSVKLLTIALVGLMATRASLASKSARIISAVSAINGCKWGLIALVDLEPASKTACGVIAGVWGLVSGGAALYDAIADPIAIPPPVVTAVYEGVFSDRNPQNGELLPPDGPPVHEARGYRILSIVGANFSWTPAEMTVTFGGAPAQILNLSTNTLLMAMVPVTGDPLPRTANIVVTVDGRVSNSFAFQIDEVLDDAAPADLISRIETKETKLLQMLKNADWSALLTQEAPNLTPAERASALNGAAAMHQGGVDILAQLPTAMQNQVEPQVVYTFERFLLTNPDVEQTLDGAIADLRARGVRPDRITQAPPPTPHP